MWTQLSGLCFFIPSTSQGACWVTLLFLLNLASFSELYLHDQLASVVSPFPFFGFWEDAVLY